MTLTHFEGGRPVMVDVSGKAETAREAAAQGRVRMSAETLALATDRAEGDGTPKGDVIGVATLAGITAAKRTADLIPLCHPLPLDEVSVEVKPDEALPGLIVTAAARTTGRTGVEMEALTAVTVACLTIYDMLKAAQKDMAIEDVRLLSKTGGKSGAWRAGEGA